MEVETKCSHAKSNKEEDLLHRNNKRIREEIDVPFHYGKEQVFSLQDKLIGLQANNVEKNIDDRVSDDEEDELEEDKNPCCPKLRLSKEEKVETGSREDKRCL